LLPLIAQIGQRDGGPVVAVLENFGILEPVSVTIALALAAGALVVDRVWGASIGCDPGRIFLLRRGAASRLAGRPWRGACLTVVLQGEHSGGASPLHNGRSAMLRNVLLRASQSEWLEERLPRLWFTRAAVRRFIPGEDLDAALAAAGALGERGIATVLTALGENVEKAEEADAVADHYVEVLDRVARSRLAAEISVKLTQLGLDLGTDATAERLERLAREGEARGIGVWIDMESSEYTDRTLELYRAVRARHANVGVCLQANLLRTSRDMEMLLENDAAIRLVKGAYREPPSRAFQSRRDIDKNYLRLADRLLREKAQRGDGLRIVFGTHDVPLVRRITEMARLLGVSKDAFEVHMLYGIRTVDQERLATAGYRLRVLISYGSAWYPWFMRRLAERPANLVLVARNLVPV